MTDTQETKPVDPVETGLVKIELGAELIPTLREGYKTFYDDAQKLIETAKTVAVKDENDNESMGVARTTRLALVKVRTGADKKRKEMKAEAQRYSKAVDGMYNVLEAWTVPVENNLFEKERYAEIKKLERQVALREQRYAELLPYKDFAPSGVDLGILDEDAYTKILTGARLSYEAHVKAEAIRVEQERIAKEEAEAKAKAEEERKAKELEEAKKAKAEAEAKAKEAEAKAKEAEAKADAERKAREREQAESEARATADKRRIQIANEQLEAKQQQVNAMAETLARQERTAPAPAPVVASVSSMPNVQDSVDFMKSHGELADSEKWNNMVSVLIDQTKITFKSEANKKTQEIVVNYLNKLIKYINDRT